MKVERSLHLPTLWLQIYTLSWSVRDIQATSQWECYEARNTKNKIPLSEVTLKQAHNMVKVNVEMRKRKMFHIRGAPCVLLGMVPLPSWRAGHIAIAEASQGWRRTRILPFTEEKTCLCCTYWSAPLCCPWHSTGALQNTERTTDMWGKSRDNIRSAHHSQLLHCCFWVLPFFRSWYLYIYVIHLCLHFAVTHFLLHLCCFFHSLFCTYIFIAPTLTASRHLELQTEMVVPNSSAFTVIEPYFKTSEKLISVIIPPFPTRNASKACRRFSPCYIAFPQCYPSLGINYLK